MYLYLEGARTVPDAVENLGKGIVLGGMETFGAMTKPVQDDSKPTVPFMVMKENRTQSSTEDTLRVVKESIHDSMYESSKTLIGDKLANVVEDFQKKQNSRNSRGRNRDRSNSRSRENSRDNYRNGNRDYYRNRSGDSWDNSRDRDRDRGRERDRSNSRERRNQPRSGSGQRYFDRGETCSFCNRSGHLAHNCFRLENYLKRKGKKIVLQDDDDVEEISQAVQHLNTKLNSLKVGKSTNN